MIKVRNTAIHPSIEFTKKEFLSHFKGRITGDVSEAYSEYRKKLKEYKKSLR